MVDMSTPAVKSNLSIITGMLEEWKEEFDKLIADELEVSYSVIILV